MNPLGPSGSEDGCVDGNYINLVNSRDQVELKPRNNLGL